MTEPERLPTMAKKVADPAPQAQVQIPAAPDTAAAVAATDALVAPDAGGAPPAPPGPAAIASPSSAAALPPETVREALRLVDAGWVTFRNAAARFPAERMDEHLTEGGWTRKQMLAHIAAWHDLTTERLGKFALGGKPVPLDSDEDRFNARVARQAVGKTAGEVLKDMEATFNKLRRRLQSMTDQQLTAQRGWAAHVIAGNTYDHYREHYADIYTPEPAEGQARRR